MSALVALFSRDGGPTDTSIVSDMLAAVPYHALDGTFVAHLGMISLGFAKRAVTPEEQFERQPLVSARTGCAIVADARLDNREELLARMHNADSAVSDAELILRAYELWALGCMERLLGDFAFLIWDPRARRLIGARDTSGQRPLYYRCAAGVFAAASEIVQLIQDPTVRVAPNENALRRFLSPARILASERDQAPETFFDGIQAVPPGCVLVVERGELRMQRYWALPRREIRYRDEAQYAEHFRELFFDVVRTRLRTSDRIGALLSGGLDSSSVVCTAHALYQDGRAQDRGFTGYSRIFDDLNYDEREYVREMRDLYNFTVREVPFAGPPEQLVLEPDHLAASPVAVRQRMIYQDAFRLAEHDGVRVLLTGDMADAYVQGSPCVLDSFIRQGKVRTFWRHLQAHRRMAGAPSLKRIMAVDVLGPLAPMPLQRRIMRWHFARRFRGYDQVLIPHWLSDTLRAELSGRFLADILDDEQHRRFSSPVRQEAYANLYPPEAAPSAAPWPIEIWRPYADRRLHDFMLAVPPEQHYTPRPDQEGGYGATKHLVRRGMRGVIPENIRLRATKTVFDSVLRQELNQRWADYASVFGPYGRSELVDRGYVDQARFWQRLQEVREGTYSIDSRYLNQMIALETWLRAIARAHSWRSAAGSISTWSQPGVDSAPVGAR